MRYRETRKKQVVNDYKKNEWLLVIPTELRCVSALRGP